MTGKEEDYIQWGAIQTNATTAMANVNNITIRSTSHTICICNIVILYIHFI